ncbi:leucyl aminopeptidase [Acuticoccus sp. M5D2P5]|uniref:leucyl aminopeptidase n=1 Tax=Acuticoccus kalidii TaxID=2910977 RepID=UPI001F165BEC|nr:leucyl aminopeptidase [Acuticoccus kalidii]MCF3935543.1 leucyl aminopeptidase [Acuticoccus kalidii]
MAKSPIIQFRPVELPKSGTLVVFAGDNMALGEAARRVDGATDGLITSAANSQGFKGKRSATMLVPLPRGLDANALLVVGLGDLTKLKEADWSKLGGTVMGALPGGPQRDVTVFAETPDAPFTAYQAADFALGMSLRAYTFDIYKSKKSDEDDAVPRTVTIALADAAAAEARWTAAAAIGEGVYVARDLTNEPPNILGPVEFAERAAQLRDLGVEVTIMEPDELERLEMRALLGVAQGSSRPARVAVMEWKNGPAEVKPVAFVGKGVVFDTGGISIKPAAGMEDMKGDMAGAAAVVGTMHALAARKAKVNAIGVIGLVENMPDGNAQRPGDIVKSKSGQTIEIINTDAEGRLVLADLLTYTIERFSPSVVIDLATLTGAIIVALGNYHAGLYSDDDTVAAQLSDSGKATGDLVWRMPLSKDYDQLIDSKVADMKNTGGRWGGSITAAQFLRRFASDATWVHLDVAGTAMGSPSNETSRTFGSGFGVRLLERFVADFYEDGADAIPRGPAA